MTVLLYVGVFLMVCGAASFVARLVIGLLAANYLLRATARRIGDDLRAVNPVSSPAAGVLAHEPIEQVRPSLFQLPIRPSGYSDRPRPSIADTSRALILMDGVSRVFYTDEVETHALKDIHLDIARGEYIAIAGPSGSGKSTLLSLLGLLDTPTAGRYWLNGRPVEHLAPAERARSRNREIGFIFQSFNLIGDLTVFENVELPLIYRGMSASERRQRSYAALERVGMTHRAKHLPSQLSGGQQQRVAVARAVVGDPLILLADEPTGNLDSRNGEMVMELLRELHHGGTTICMVTHDPRYAAHADRSIHLFDGRVVELVQELSLS